MRFFFRWVTEILELPPAQAWAIGLGLIPGNARAQEPRSPRHALEAGGLGIASTRDPARGLTGFEAPGTRGDYQP